MPSDHLTGRLGTLITTINAFLGIVLIPAGLLYLGDVESGIYKVGAAWMGVGILLSIATLRYLSAERQKYAPALLATVIAIVGLRFVDWFATNATEETTASMRQFYDQVKDAPTFAARTDMGRLVFVRDATSVALLPPIALGAWLMLRLLQTRPENPTQN